MRSYYTTIVLLFVLGGTNDLSAADAPSDSNARRLAPIVITPTRVEQSSFDLPVSIDVIEANVVQSAQPQVNLSETLVRVPGIVAQNRQNYAQDLQISSRGFGARSTFGVRGIRLLADGIPATSPDGQGQAATFDLSTARRIEVMRGPFSALYGNSSAGVIAVFTEDGPSVPTITADALIGSFDTSKFGVKFGAEAGALNFIGHGSRFDTDGYRDHSAATRDQLNTKFRYKLSEDASLTFVAAALHQPDTQDPLGLTRAQVDANRRAAAPAAEQFNTRKTILHDQEGLIYERRLSSANSLRVLGYVGDRRVEQYLALQGSGALSSGGVVDLDRQFGGVDLRLTHQRLLSGNPFTLTGGIAYDNQEERRRGFVNNFGTAGALQRDEDDRVYNVDEYLQGQWRFAPRWSTSIGVRHSEVRFKTRDYFITASNPDDSGEVRYSATNPVAGLLYNATPRLNLYANAGRGFETPTFAELAYRPDGTSGLNFALQPATSGNVEVGMKAFPSSTTQTNVVLFHVQTKNEIVVASNIGGRSTFQNASRTERRGVEASIDHGFSAVLFGYFALTYIDAVYDEQFVTSGTTIPVGNRIPGVPQRTAYGEIAWKPIRGLETALETRWTDRIFVNDANTEAAPGYGIANWRIGFEQRGSRWDISEFVRIDNLFDKDYIGSVIVNAGGNQYYEPAPGRNYTIGIRGRFRF